MTRDIQQQARDNAERLRVQTFKSLTSNVQQCSKENIEALPSSPLMMSSDSVEDTATVLEDEDHEYVQLCIQVQSDILCLLDELIHMNLASDREDAAGIMLQLAGNEHREFLLTHAKHRKKLQEMTELFIKYVET
ncbi:hypothetical protein [Paenibacillus pini]|uniref:Uncharacterized protein n=1 Tax=Paenibacillus pini JCM 16418 TaxID=1236976 RepID=W7Z6H9_9BACL|nr:hypothetical protein [Paenibacillus pini]GAF09924.1 hypothetical protein JCM16418_4088 [Paenibacillus pini JCM 16418]